MHLPFPFSAAAARAVPCPALRFSCRPFLVAAVCAALCLTLAAQRAAALTPKADAAITDETLLPYAREVQLLEESLRRSPGEEGLAGRLADLKLFQAQKAATALEVRLLQQVVELWDKAPGPPDAASLPVRVTAAASLQGTARQKAFARARAAYLQATELTDAEPPGGMALIGWLNLLAGTAVQRAEPGLRAAFAEEIARIAPPGAIPGTTSPLEELFAAGALLKCAALPELSPRMAAFLRAAMRHLDRAEAGSDAPEQINAPRRERLAGSVSLYRGLALLLRASASKAKARQESLRGFCDALWAYLAATPSYSTAYDDPRLLSREQGEALWKNAEKTLSGQPLFLAGRALWLQKNFLRQRGEKEEIRDLLLEAARKAPGESRVWAAAALVAQRDSYDEILKAEKSRIYAYDACAAKTRTGSWSLWSEAAAKARHALDAANLHILTDEITAADRRFACPAFAAWAHGVLATRQWPEDAPRAARFFEKAAALPHPPEAKALIYGQLGEVWRTAAGRGFSSNDASPQRLALRQKARAAYRAAARAFAAAPQSSAHPEEKKDFPWRQAYASVLTDLLRSPACALDEALLDEARALTVREAAPESAKSLHAWAGALRDAAGPPYRNETPQDEARARELYALLLGVYDRLEALEPGADLYAARGEARLQQAKLTPAGQRAEAARAAMADYEKILSLRADGHAHAGLARALLLLGAESPLQDIPALMRRAYANFCLAAGLPQDTPRSRRRWSEVVGAAARDAEPAAQQAMTAALP